mmetsp:Transcript_14334/g.20875  ORF Transcript_14334/g.20875 Transcript_14334/m.20875 type:complete len:95 (-) Transcript_14334:3-287(-)
MTLRQTHTYAPTHARAPTQSYTQVDTQISNWEQHSYAYERVKSRICISHVTQMNVSCQGRTAAEGSVPAIFLVWSDSGCRNSKEKIENSPGVWW